MLVLGLMAGLAATAAFIDSLPKLSRLGPVALGENSSVYARDCTRKPCQDEALGVIARTENRISVRWKDIAPTMRSATVAIEDRRYWEHGALDWHGIARAAINNLEAGGIRQGGSTISQQLAKNLYLQRQASSRSISRKLDEAWIAVQLQDKYTKAEILTAYLNTVFYGESAYGVEAAAHTFFDRTAKQLTLAQSALLAGLPQAPSAYNPFVHPAAAQKRRAEVLDAMRELRWISADAYAEAVNAPLGLKRGSYGTPSSSPFVFDQVRQELNARLPAKLAARGGLRVYSTVDQRLQFAARRAIKGVLKTPGGPSAALVAINVHNGNVLALGTSDYGSAKNQFNLATAGHRSPGSTFKLFALVDALRRGADPSRVYYPSGYVKFPESDPVCPHPGGWSPRNADGGGGGYLSLESATVHSVNVVYAQLMRDLTPKRVAQTAHLLGVRSKLPLHCSMVLGADDVTPLELTSAYATIAAGGVYHRPRTIRRVEDADGKIVAEQGVPRPGQARRQRRRRVRGHADPQAGRLEGHGHAGAARRRPAAGGQDRDGRELRQRLVLRLHARHRGVRVGRVPLVEQAARERRGLRRRVRRHDPRDDLEGLHDDRARAHRAARLARAQAPDGLQGLRGDHLVRLQPRPAGGSRGAAQEARQEEAEDAGRAEPRRS